MEDFTQELDTSSMFQNLKQPITPLMARQILSCRQSEFKLFGSTIHLASIVGVLRKITVESNQINCYFDDNTGTIPGIIYEENEIDLRNYLTSMKENHYMQAYGKIRKISGIPTLMVAAIKPIDDANVITTHFLEAIHTRLAAEAEFKQKVSAANTTGAELATALVICDEEPSGTNDLSHLNYFQSEVLKIIKAENSQYGMIKKAILLQFPAYQGHEVNAALQFLISAGLIYPTIDEQHFKSIN